MSFRTWKIHQTKKHEFLLQRWFFRKLMASRSLKLGIDSSGRIYSTMELIPRRNRFLLYKSFKWWHMFKVKSLFQLLKLWCHKQWATLFHTRFYLVPTWFLSPLADSKKGLRRRNKKYNSCCVSRRTLDTAYWKLLRRADLARFRTLLSISKLEGIQKSL